MNNNFWNNDESDIESDNDSYASNETKDFYEPEEPSTSKYNLVLCEKYSKKLHGNIKGMVNNHYLTHFRLCKLNINLINHITKLNPNIKIEIAECLFLDSGHCVSILKTFWLRIIQRTWKKIYLNRKKIIQMRSNPQSIYHREIFNQWPNHCSVYPSLKGMLLSMR
jgi:hypothetical protein